MTIKLQHSVAVQINRSSLHQALLILCSDLAFWRRQAKQAHKHRFFVSWSKSMNQIKRIKQYLTIIIKMLHSYLYYADLTASKPKDANLITAAQVIEAIQFTR